MKSLVLNESLPRVERNGWRDAFEQLELEIWRVEIRRVEIR